METKKKAATSRTEVDELLDEVQRWQSVMDGLHVHKGPSWRPALREALQARYDESLAALEAALVPAPPVEGV